MTSSGMAATAAAGRSAIEPPRVRTEAFDVVKVGVNAPELHTK